MRKEQYYEVEELRIIRLISRMKFRDMGEIITEKQLKDKIINHIRTDRKRREAMALYLGQELRKLAQKTAKEKNGRLVRWGVNVLKQDASLWVEVKIGKELQTFSYVL